MFIWRNKLDHLPNDVAERIIDHIFEDKNKIMRFYITNTLQHDLYHKRIEFLRNKIKRKYNLRSWKECSNNLSAFKEYIKTVYLT